MERLFRQKKSCAAIPCTVFLLALLFFKAGDLTAQNNRLWATYYGDNGLEEGTFTATDASGNVYLSGYTTSATGIASGGFQNTYGGNQDAFLVKFDGAGNRLWATYYGGPDGEWGRCVAVDAAGNVYLSGTTASMVSIASGGFQNTMGGGVVDAFLVKFDASGNRLWATYYGGSGDDFGSVVTTDPSGNVFLGGNTWSASGIASGGFQNVFAGAFWDAYLVKFDANGNRIWGTYYGGTGEDDGCALAADASGNIFLAGITNSNTAIAAGGFLNTYAGGIKDAFLVKFDASGNRLWATYYGDAAEDRGKGLATDASGNVYLAGETNSNAGIASGGYQNTFGGSLDAMLIKFDAAGNRLWATYYGGSDVDEGYSVAVDAAGNPFLGGDSYSLAGISLNAFQPNLIGVEDEMVVKFDPAGNLQCATYFGFSHDEDGRVAVDGSGNVYLVGYTISSSGIASGGFQNTYGGAQDAYLVKFTTCSNSLSVSTTATSIPCNGVCNATATASPLGGNGPYTYLWNTSPSQTGATATGLCAGTYTVLVTDANGNTASAIVTVTQPPPVQLSATSAPDTCATNTGAASVSPGGGTPGYTYAWSNGVTNDSISGLAAGTYSVIVTDANGCADTAFVTIGNTGSAIADAGISDTIAQGQSVTLTGTGGGTYSWSPADGLSCTTCPNPEAAPAQTTTYTLTVTDANGCTDTDVVTVYVLDAACGEIFIPNAFSPNGDGENDVLYVRGNCIRYMQLEIYNRWGECVFRSTSTSNGWDGSWRGQACEAAVFAYTLNVTLNDGTQVSKKGNVSLVK